MPANAPPPYDIAVIGAGIVGLATAHALRGAHPGLRLAVVEKEARVAAHQSSHNSGVIHAGIYYRPGSHRARLCVEGARRMTEFCEARGIPYDRCGKVIVAVSESELPRLEALFERGNANGVPGLQRIGPERLRELEPHARALQAVYSPATAVVDFGRVAAALADEIARGGADVRTGGRVRAIRRMSDRSVLETERGAIECRRFINCAGLYSDEVARLAGLRPAARIIPFRGEYYLMRPERRLVRGLIYPVPDPTFPFLGVHFTKRIQGDYEAGPNAVLAFAREGYRFGTVHARELLSMLAFGGFWRMAGRYWRTGLAEMVRSLSRTAFVRELQKLIPELRDADVEPGGAGVRAMAVSPDGLLLDDFVITEAPGAIHVLNAPSPAATASLEIGRAVASLATRSFGLA